MQLNKVQLIGNLTKPIELKALPNGNKVANFSIVTNRTWKDKDGQKQEDAEFHNVVAFGKQAEVLAQYAVKGQQFYIEGRLQTRKWEKDGVDRYSTEIIMENFQFGQKPKSSNLSDEEAQKVKDFHESVNKPVEEDDIASSIPF